MLKVRLHPLHQILIAAQMRRSDGAMDALAEMAVVEIRNVSGDQFPFAGRKRVGAEEQDLHKLVQRSCGFGPEGHGSADAGQSFGESNVGHGDSLLSSWGGSCTSSESAFAFLSDERMQRYQHRPYDRTIEKNEIVLHLKVEDSRYGS